MCDEEAEYVDAQTAAIAAHRRPRLGSKSLKLRCPPGNAGVKKWRKLYWSNASTGYQTKRPKNRNPHLCISNSDPAAQQLVVCRARPILHQRCAAIRYCERLCCVTTNERRISQRQIL